MDALLALGQDGRGQVGRDRIALLEAVAEHGSISQAAKVVGLSYKAAWDGLNTINNLLPKPAITTQAGGKRGGGAELTPDGRALIRAFRELESRLNRLTGLFPAEGEAASLSTLLWSLGMRTSARNMLVGTVSALRKGAVNDEVAIRLNDQQTVIATITSDSVETLGLQVGKEVAALIKSNFILLAAAEPGLRISARNQIPGTILHREDGAVSSEFILDIGDGKTLTAIITRDSAEELGLHAGDPALALIKASHIILAVA